jgi:hypothetical protein
MMKPKQPFTQRYADNTSMAALHTYKIHEKKMESPICQALPPFTCNYKVFGLRGIFILLNFYLANESSLPFIELNLNHSTIKYY